MAQNSKREKRKERSEKWKVRRSTGAGAVQLAFSFLFSLSGGEAAS
jgi:hypothetical protein